MMKNSKITMKDIAELCDVTKTTISRYFNGGYVKKETKDRISKVIKKYNYEPNAFARLKARQSYMIGIITPAIDSVSASRLLTGLEKVFREKKYIPIIINTNYDTKLELVYLEKLKRLNVDGIVLNATEVSDEHRKMIRKLKIPVVVYGQQFPDGVSVINDDYNAGREIGEYIGKKNYKYVGYITEKDSDIEVNRKNGIADGLKKYNVKKVNFENADFSYDSAKRAANKLLLNKKINIIICSSDKHAHAVYRVIMDKGLKIPDDISVISFGAYNIDDVIEPKLSTIKFDYLNAGVRTANVLLELINNNKSDKIHYIDYEFIEGESVK